MMKLSQSGLGRVLRIFIFASAFTPLIVVPFAPFPFVFGKMVLVRSIAGVGAALGILYGLRTIRERGWRVTLRSFRNPVLVAVAVFILSAAVSTVFAPSPYRGFFGEVERGEGLYGLVAYFVIFAVAFFAFDETHWRAYFRLGLSVGAIVMVHVFLRYFEVAFPFALGSTRQPGSFLGNPAFVASFVILLLAHAVFVHQDSKGFWRYFSVATGLAGLAVLGLLGIRGALVGIAAGAFVLAIGRSVGAKRRWLKWGPLAAFAALLLLGALVRLTPSPLWSRVPVFDRIATFSLEGASVQSRLLSWGVSWDAFRERPLLGWGPEHYGIAYNAHYDPSYAIYAEEFFDRAHNKIFDVLVMQGAVGGVSYLAVFAALFYVLFTTKELERTRLLLGAIIVAYFVQNLFTFDHVSSYLPFFTVLSFCASRYAKERPGIADGRFVLPRSRFLVWGAAAVLMLAAGYSVVAWNVIPLVQAKSRAATPYNFFQKDMRMWRLDVGREPVTAKTLAALEEVASKEPQDVRLMVRLAEGYHDAGKDNPEFLAKSVAYVKKARELSPKRQTILGLYALILSERGEHEEAIQRARDAVALEPRAARSHYWLGMVLALSGFESVKEEALRELNVALDGARELAAQGSYVLFFESDFSNMMVAHQNLGAADGLLEVYRVAREFFPQNLSFHRIGLAAARAQRDAEEMIRIAERIQKLEPGSRDEMEVIIDLARKGKWEILDSL